MTYEDMLEILEKAIIKAIANGWKPNFVANDFDTAIMAQTFAETPKLYLYSHDFAKALWGDGPSCAYCGARPHNMHYGSCIEGSNIWPYLWEYHLQHMVIASDPVMYLGQYFEASK